MSPVVPLTLHVLCQVVSCHVTPAALLACEPCWNWWDHSGSIDTPTCKLSGVTCGSDGVTVTTLNMGERVMMGRLPAAFGNLTGLTMLDFHSNKLSGTLHAEWSGLGKLEYLDLHSNQLTGPLPRDWSKGMRRISVL